MLGGCTSQRRKELEEELAAANAAKAGAIARADRLDAELKAHVERADKALNLAKEQLLKAKAEAEEQIASCSEAKGAANRADKANAARVAALEDARKKENAR